jgi:hypothetical protein
MLVYQTSCLHARCSVDSVTKETVTRFFPSEKSCYCRARMKSLEMLCAIFISELLQLTTRRKLLTYTNLDWHAAIR